MRKNEYILPPEYERVLAAFFGRLSMKHAIKGTTHLDFDIKDLHIILREELEELVEATTSSNIIEEALDVMISAMLIAHKVLEDAY